MSFGPVIGFTVEVRDPQNLPPHADRLRRAVEAAFGTVGLRRQEHFQPDKIALVVGVKPLE